MKLPTLHVGAIATLGAGLAYADVALEGGIVRTAVATWQFGLAAWAWLSSRDSHQIGATLLALYYFWEARDHLRSYRK